MHQTLRLNTTVVQVQLVEGSKTRYQLYAVVRDASAVQVQILQAGKCRQICDAFVCDLVATAQIQIRESAQTRYVPETSV